MLGPRAARGVGNGFPDLMWATSNGIIMAEAQVFRRSVSVKSEHGLHIRPCTQLAQLSMKYQSRVRLGRDGKFVDAKSILELMTLGAASGSVLELEVEGPDAAEAMEHLAALFETHFAPPSQPAAAHPASVTT